MTSEHTLPKISSGKTLYSSTTTTNDTEDAMVSTLAMIIKSESKQMVKDAFGSVEGLAAAVGCVELEKGLRVSKGFDLQAQRERFGSNAVEFPPIPTLLDLLLGALSDTTIILLILSAIVSLVLGLGVEQDFETGWVEGTSILSSVTVVISVQALTDYSKAKELRRQEIQIQEAHHVSVLRDGDIHVVHPREVVVGDVLRLQVGDIICADGLLIQGSDIEMDESSLTGESETLEKGVGAAENPFIFSGTNVLNGSGRMLVLAIGKYSRQGAILESIFQGSEEADEPDDSENGCWWCFSWCRSSSANEETKPLLPTSTSQPHGETSTKIPLRSADDLTSGSSNLVEKLNVLAYQISKAGVAAATITSALLIVRWMYAEFVVKGGLCAQQSGESACLAVANCTFDPASANCARRFVVADFKTVLEYFVTGVTLLVVALPEGLPLAVTLALAVSMRRMMVDNNQVKHIDSCETMGSATTICTDKTGTLTTNRMTACLVALGLQRQDDQLIVVDSTLTTSESPATQIGGHSKDGTLGDSLLDLLAETVSLCSAPSSSSVRDSEHPEKWIHKGNATDCALLRLATELGYDPGAIRANPRYRGDASYQLEWGIKTIPFSSSRKRMSWIVPCVDTVDVAMGGNSVEAGRGAGDSVEGSTVQAAPSGAKSAVGSEGSTTSAAGNDNEPRPANSETPPADGETPPADGETPPAVNETPPANSETPPAVNETPPADNHQTTAYQKPGKKSKRKKKRSKKNDATKQEQTQCATNGNSRNGVQETTAGKTQTEETSEPTTTKHVNLPRTTSQQRDSENTTRKPKFRLFCKGAPQYVLATCEGVLDSSGTRAVPLTASIRGKCAELVQTIESKAMRGIALAYRDFYDVPAGGWDEPLLGGRASGQGLYEAESKLTLVGIVGIEDPLRSSATDAIKQCRTAGIDVRMCTGDSLKTAVEISKRCGIIQSHHLERDGTPKHDVAMTGEEFCDRIHALDATKAKVRRRAFVNGRMQDDVDAFPFLLHEKTKKKIIDQAEFDRIWPHLRVLARCAPEDKLHLVQGIRASNLYQDEAACERLFVEDNIFVFPDRQVVAVTGDGTNDAPALKESDVGFAMGIVGTATAKEACDILLLDDNFESILKAVMWGRNVFDCISKFIQFQLTVNIVAITVSIVGALMYKKSPLSSVQMLWVNMIMDSLASLALATEYPTPELLERMPYGKNQGIITRVMLTNIFGHSAFQLVILFGLLTQPSLIPGNVAHFKEDLDSESSVHLTFFFNAFVMLQLFNEFNSRKLQSVDKLRTTYSEWFVLNGITDNWMFIGIVGFCFAAQIVIVQFGGRFVSLAIGGLSASQWLVCVAIGASEILWQVVINVGMVLTSAQGESTSGASVLPMFQSTVSPAATIVKSSAQLRGTIAARKRWAILKNTVRFGSYLPQLVVDRVQSDDDMAWLDARSKRSKMSANMFYSAFPTKKLQRAMDSFSRRRILEGNVRRRFTHDDVLGRQKAAMSTRQLTM